MRPPTVDAAKAQFYPDINLSPSSACPAWGWTASSTPARTYGVGPALHLPLFDGGRLRAQLERAAPTSMPTIVAYNGTVAARCARWPTR